MEIKKPAIAGTLESSDCMVTVDPGQNGIDLDLEDAVAEKEKDAARFSLFHALREINYRGVERIVRIPKTETAEDVRRVEAAVIAAEKEFGAEEGRTLIMAALESAKGVLSSVRCFRAVSPPSALR